MSDNRHSQCLPVAANERGKRDGGRCDLCGILAAKDDEPHVHGRCESCRRIYGTDSKAKVYEALWNAMCKRVAESVRVEA